MYLLTVALTQPCGTNTTILTGLLNIGKEVLKTHYDLPDILKCTHQTDTRTRRHCIFSTHAVFCCCRVKLCLS